MGLFFDISPILKLLGVFALIVLLLRARVSLGAALAGSAVALGIWFRMSLWQLATSMAGALADRRTLSLCAIVTLILILSHSMEKSGQMERLLRAFRGLSENMRLNLALFPALIGLLPMPGGAIFSAPMVRSISGKAALRPEHVALINYWFRHIWEFCWPLYPGVILASALSGIGLRTFVLVQLPLTLVMAWVGYLSQLRPVRVRSNGSESPRGKSPARFIQELSPILLVVIGALLLGELSRLVGSALPLFQLMGHETSLIVTLTLSILWVWRRGAMGLREIAGVFLNRALLSMVSMIAGIMVFESVLKNSQAVSAISQQLISADVPLVLVVAFLPFVVGAVTGITVAFVGATFPIVFSILSGAGLADQVLPYTVLAFCSGYVGVLISPLHACLVLTCAYFRASMRTTYHSLWWLCGTMAGAGAVSFGIVRSMGW